MKFHISCALFRSYARHVGAIESKRCFASLNMTMDIFCTLPLVIALALPKQSNVFECSTRLVAALVALARNDVRYWRCGFNRTQCATKVAPPRIPKKARAKLWRSHSTAALWILLSLIFHCSLILTSQPQRTRLCSHINIDEALWSMT